MATAGIAILGTTIGMEIAASIGVAMGMVVMSVAIKSWQWQVFQLRNPNMTLYFL